ncbi:hypothetical protein IX51_05885 [uncultured archaeon]|nr:hypothetical protein IX51_05885 [uncultured archaeon]
MKPGRGIDERQAKGKPGKLPVVVQMLLFMTLGNFSNSSYSPLAPFIKNSFLLTSAEVGLITSVIFMGAITVSLFSGFLVDRLGPYTAIKISFAIIASGAVIIFLGHTYSVLIGGYYAIGFGYGIITPASNSLMMKEYYPDHATRMGVKQSGVPLGAAFSAAILPIIALNFTLRGSYLILIIMALAIAIVLPWERRKESGQRIGKGYIKDLLSAGRSRPLLAVAVAVVFLSWGQQTLLTFFVLFEESKGIPIIFAEALLIVLLAGSVFGRMFWAYVSDRVFRKNRVHTLSLIMAIAGLVFVMFNLNGSNYALAVAFSFIIGMNAVGWNSTYVTVISEIAPRAKVGLFSGVSLMLTGMGTIIGTPVSGVIRDMFSFMEMWTVLGSALMVMSMVFLFVGSKYVKSSYS